MVEEATKLLMDSQNLDGGWGSAKGRRSNTEATSLALMALASLKQDSMTAPRIRRAISWLTQRQGTDGSWPLSDSSKIPSWSTAMAMLALGLWPEHQDQVINAAKWVLGQEGRKLGWLAKLMTALSFRHQPVDLNDDLTGWPWITGTFSWVEPTGYFLIALKKWRHRLKGTGVEERIRQGELMIYDRMCKDGGWNYGNSVVLGEKLWPYPDTTAIALVALQDHRDADANRKSLRALEGMLHDVDSGLALSWSVMCLTLYGQDAGKWKKLLVKSFDGMRFLGETNSIALSILAMGAGAKFFEV